MFTVVLKKNIFRGLKVGANKDKENFIWMIVCYETVNVGEALRRRGLA